MKKKAPAATKKSSETAAKKTASAKKVADEIFPVAGIGASAGGVEAVSDFLSFLPVDLGIAYVVVQHLAPNHESILTEILERKTAMPVLEVRNNMELAPDHVYVIPPNAYISLTDGVLKLIHRERADNIPHPIDYFLTDLACIYQHYAIGIILSGTANDGTLGLKAVKAQGGITFAQDASAQFQGMPYNATRAGHVDYVLSPEDIAKKLAFIIKHPGTKGILLKEVPPGKEAELRKIGLILHNKCDVDFTHYKQTTIRRRIMRRMLLNHVKNLEQYAQMLRESDTEVNALYQDLLINVTCFFRDPGIFRLLSKKVFPSLFKGRKPNDPLRIWISGCATGEEACSFAISLIEYLGDKAVSTPVQIFATDLNETAIEKARLGIYAKSALENVSPQRLKRFFTRIDGSYQVIKAIRDMCVFAPHNLLKDPPFSRMDIISCQNVLIYLEASAQKKILQAFHYALKPEGVMLLGKSETVGSSTDLFGQKDKEYKIYHKKAVVPYPHFDFSIQSKSGAMEHLPEEYKSPEQTVEPDLEKETDKLLLSRYVPPTVVVNKDLEILRFRGSISSYLDPASGKASLNLLKMVRDELVFELRSLIYRAKKEGRPTKKTGLHLPVNEHIREVNLEVVPIRSPSNNPYFVILFKEGPLEAAAPGKGGGRKKTDARDQRIESLEQELREAGEHMKSMSEEFEATREELQSANEEVLSSNEELQSINEELETSKEELQSTNEELTTINEELQHRNVDLKEAHDYSSAIVETMREPLLVLNADLRVRMANNAFYRFFQTSPDDTEGFFFYEIGNGQWNIPGLRRQLNEVHAKNHSLHNLELRQTFTDIGEKVILLSAARMQQEETRRDKLRILVTIDDITEWKKADEELKVSEERFRLLVQNSSDIIAIFTEEGKIRYLSPSIKPALGYDADNTVGRDFFSGELVHPDDVIIKDQMIRDCIKHPQQKTRAELRLKDKDGSYHIMDVICVNLLQDKRVEGIVANCRDITERKKLEQQKDEFIGIASHELKTPVTTIKAYTQILQEQFRERSDAGLKKLADKMDAQVDRLTRLISDLLDVTKITGGQLKFRDDLYDLNELIEEVVEETQAVSQRHKIEMKLQPSRQLQGDRERTGQVLANLLSNAVKYSPEQDHILVTTITSARDEVTVCVHDFGIGMPMEMHQRVFERFFRINDAAGNTFPGMGLGLYIAAESVKRQGGKIWVESKKGEGSVFCFSLPVKRD